MEKERRGEVGDELLLGPPAIHGSATVEQLTVRLRVDREYAYRLILSTRATVKIYYIIN